MTKDLEWYKAALKRQRALTEAYRSGSHEVDLAKRALYNELEVEGHKRSALECRVDSQQTIIESQASIIRELDGAK